MRARLTGITATDVVLADGFKDAMALAFGRDGAVYLATRSTIYRMRDKEGTAADQKVLVRLETTCTYPHNGLAGFAMDGLGNVYFGMGENLGAEFKLIGSDGSTETNLEGGQIYRCKADGGQLECVAFGFWNPFHLTLDAFATAHNILELDTEKRVSPGSERALMGRLISLFQTVSEPLALDDLPPEQAQARALALSATSIGLATLARTGRLQKLGVTSGAVLRELAHCLKTAPKRDEKTGT